MSSLKFGKKSGAEIATVPAISKAVVFSDPRCKICKSVWRHHIDFCLATGWSNAKTMQYFNELLPPDEKQFNPTNFSTHARKHLTIRDDAVRSLMEEQARQHGIDVDTIKGVITTRRGFAESVIQQALSNMVRGTAAVEIKDALAAIQIIEKMEEKDSGASVAELEREIRIFMDAVKKVVPESMWQAIAEEYRRGVNEQGLVELPPETIESSAVAEIEEGDLDD